MEFCESFQVHSLRYSYLVEVSYTNLAFALSKCILAIIFRYYSKDRHKGQKNLRLASILEMLIHLLALGYEGERWKPKVRLILEEPVNAFVDTLPFAECVTEYVTFAWGLAPCVTEGKLWVLAEYKLINGKKALGRMLLSLELLMVQGIRTAVQLVNAAREYVSI